MKSCVISLGQMQCSPEGVECNTEKIVSWICACADAGSRLLVLPELALTGYRAIDVENEGESLRARIAYALGLVSAQSAGSGVDVLIGYPLISADGVYIVSSYIERGNMIATHRKVNLCNYAHYTEHLHFIPGDEVTCARAGIANFGVIICEDSWHPMNAITASLLGAEILLNPSAASVTNRANAASCLENWKRISVGTAFTQTSYYVLCNQAGPAGDGVYMGGSHVVDPAGHVIGTPMSTDEELRHIPLDGAFLACIRENRPLLQNERAEIYGKYFVSP